MCSFGPSPSPGPGRLQSCLTSTTEFEPMFLKAVTEDIGRVAETQAAYTLDGSTEPRTLVDTPTPRFPEKVPRGADDQRQ